MLFAEVLEEFATSVEKTLELAARKAPGGDSPVFVGTIPKLSQELPSPAKFVSEARWILPSEEMQSAEDTEYARLNPFPKMFIQLQILPLIDWRGPWLFEAVKDWLLKFRGRKAFLLVPSRHRMYSISEMSHGEFLGLIWPAGDPKLEEWLGQEDTAKLAKLAGSARGERYSIFYRRCRKLERYLIHNCLFGGSSYRPLLWLVITVFRSPRPNEYPFNDTRSKPGFYTVAVLVGFIAIAILIGALVAPSLFALRVWNSLLLADSAWEVSSVLAIGLLAMYTQLLLLGRLFGTQRNISEENESTQFDWLLRMINVVPLFLIINAGATFGMWEATLSLGQAVGLLITVMFSPVIIGGSVVYAITSASSDAIHLSCGAIFEVAQISGLSGLDLIFGMARFCIRVLLSPVFDQDLWFAVTGLITPDSVFDLSWQGLSTWAVYLTYLIFFAKCFLVG